jgi:predicted  nucleic acid-binding Zn-ribbon protein
MALFSKLAVRREEPADHPLIRQLDGLLVEVREERQKLEVVLSSVRGGDAASVPRVLERLEQRASALADQLDAASGRADDLRRAWADADGLHARIEALHQSLDGAEARTEQTARSTVEVSGQLAGVQELVSVAQTTLSALESLVHHGHIASLLEQIPVVRKDCERVVDQQSSLAMQLGELQTSTTALMRKAMTAEEVATRATEQ